VTAASAASSSIQTLGGRRLRVVERPGASPPVVLLGGCGVPSTLWQPVVDRLPGRRVLRLDRPGMGGTRWPDALPRLAEEVSSLEALVATLDAPPVLVAHSMAGPHAEAFVRQHPDQVAGVVLIDGSVEWERARPSGPVGPRLWYRLARLARSLLARRRARTARRVAGSLAWVAATLQTSVRSPEVRQAVRAAFADPDAVAAAIAEHGAYAGQLRDLAELRRTRAWPAVPVVVLSAGRGTGASWWWDQRRLAALVRGRQVVVEDARHLMMLDCPDVVADAIRAVDA
jgi:pimeloyl-ACP methyl ester carboxylesterase